jgi:hypothetical protein
MIAGIERFIATAIRLVRIEPEAPTIIPATISAGLFSATPVAAAESPVERVQHRDHDRHVGAADRQHDGVAEHRGAEQHQDEDQLRVRAVGDEHREPIARRPRAARWPAAAGDRA